MTDTQQNIAIIIPVRMASTRLPRKCLLRLGGNSIVQHVYLNAKKTGAARVIVACDHERIVNEIESIGGEAALTPPECPSGTDRIALVARDVSQEVILNVQGDEPFLKPDMMLAAAEPLARDRSLQMSTLAVRESVSKTDSNPNRVKVVTDSYGNALYFSRSLIPFPRDLERVEALHHIGLYAYRRDFLLQYAGWPEAELEKTERLEQLRALSRGIRIRVVEVEYTGFGIDTPEDYERAKEICDNIIS